MILNFPKFKIYPAIPKFTQIVFYFHKLFVWLLVFLSAVSDVLDVRTLGLNDDAYDNDPEDPNYEEEPVDELEGKSYHPLLDHVEPSFSKIKLDQQIKPDFY